MTKKILIDEEACIGCNTCPLMSPEIFGFNEDNYKAKIIKQPGNITPEIQNTIDSCPVTAISIVDEQ